MQACASPIFPRHPGRSEAESRDPGAVRIWLAQPHAAGPYLTTKLTKDTKFGVISEDGEWREARVFSLAPSLVSLVSLVVKYGLRPSSPTVDWRPSAVRRDLITLNPC